MALSQRKTTIAVLRGILGPIHGQEDRFARLAKRSPSWVKKVSAGIIPLTEDTARRLELETSVPLDWLMGGRPNARPVKGNGKRYTFKDFEWHRARVKAGEPFIRSVGLLFPYALDIVAIGSAAGEQGMASLFMWRLRTFLDECTEEFGFDKDKRSQAESELRKAPNVASIAFADKGSEPVALVIKRFIRGVSKKR